MTRPLREKEGDVRMELYIGEHECRVYVWEVRKKLQIGIGSLTLKRGESLDKIPEIQEPIRRLLARYNLQITNQP